MNILGERIIHLFKASQQSGVILFFLLSFPSAWPITQGDNLIRMQDNSDWWSENRTSEPDEVSPQKREFARSTFRVLGITLGEKMFDEASSKLGRVALIQRGDASTGRTQACYVSPGEQEKVHLIFEQGEVEFAFYIFADGPSWEGSDNCVTSKQLSRSLATTSGLHLGQTPAQVIAMLGKPTKQHKNELIYSFSVRKQTSAEALKQARQRNPEMTDREFQETYGFYNLGACVHAKFANSKLAYLAVSKVESN